MTARVRVRVIRYPDTSRVVRELMARLNTHGKVAKVGFPTESVHGDFDPGKENKQGKKYDSYASLILVAATHEFGSPERNIPERSFLRAGLRNSDAIEKFRRVNRTYIRKVLRGQVSIETALDALGQAGAGEVRSYIRQGSFDPLSPITIARKKSSRPLIDSANMRQSITSVVEVLGD